MNLIPCDLCGQNQFYHLFDKSSSRNEVFSINECKNCGLVQVNPQPDLEAVTPYYGAHYFEKRTDRGYDNYFSEEMKRNLFRVYEMNLSDAGFFEFEKSLADSKGMCLDVGCAAGYFVEYMKERRWDAAGIEISESAASYGIEKLGLNIHIGDFFSDKNIKENSYDFITLWASIEHMHSPGKVMRRVNQLLKPGGRFILTTCRWGILSRMRGLNWRYMNVPEHLYFFTMKNMKTYAKKSGFNVHKSFTYGSGFTAKKDSGFLYRAAKKLFDPLVKITNQGDMMVFHMEKRSK